MAPGYMCLDSEQKTLSLADLKKGDFSSRGMMMFLLLNPDLECPLQIELDQLQNGNFEECKKDFTPRFMQGMKRTFSKSITFYKQQHG